MAGKTFVFLITGFLGSGKTTFLNRVIRQFPGDRKLMILMNEFGEVDVDGTLVEGEDLDMVEISKGSIFCACVKTDFVKALNSIAQTIRPDVLLIESTGVANPSDLKRDLRLSIFKDRFQFQEQFCMIDAGHFLDAYGAYQSIEKQLASSTVFLINKTDYRRWGNHRSDQGGGSGAPSGPRVSRNDFRRSRCKSSSLARRNRGSVLGRGTGYTHDSGRTGQLL